MNECDTNMLINRRSGFALNGICRVVPLAAVLSLAALGSTGCSSTGGIAKTGPIAPGSLRCIGATLQYQDLSREGRLLPPDVARKTLCRGATPQYQDPSREGRLLLPGLPRKTLSPGGNDF